MSETNELRHEDGRSTFEVDIRRLEIQTLLSNKPELQKPIDAFAGLVQPFFDKEVEEIRKEIPLEEKQKIRQRVERLFNNGLSEALLVGQDAKPVPREIAGKIEDKSKRIEFLGYAIASLVLGMPAQAMEAFKAVYHRLSNFSEEALPVIKIARNNYPDLVRPEHLDSRVLEYTGYRWDDNKKDYVNVQPPRQHLWT